MTSLKIAMQARQRTGAEVFSFYIDIRAVGKYCEEFYEQTQQAGVVFIHGKGTEVIYRDGSLLVKAEDIVLGRRVIVPVDMAVLGVGFVPRPDAAEVGKLFGVGCTREGFFMERQVKFAPVQTANEGVFIAGTCQSPKDIPDCVAHGAAAAAGALGLLDKGVVDTLPTVARVDPELCSNCRLCISECPYGAIAPSVHDHRDVVRVEELLCAGCGSCAATCPAGAITQLGYTRGQLVAEIRGLLAQDRESGVAGRLGADQA
jgi:heterodisulfide reductase subunit A